jgi:hypothetical protein
MQERLNSSAGDRLKQAVVVAIEAVLSRRGLGRDQAEMLRILRQQLGQVLAEAPVRGDAVDGIAFRARLAALSNAEIDRLEAGVGEKGMEGAPDETPTDQEKRRWHRHPVRLSAQVSTGVSTFDCVVVDLSEGGAQVDFATPVPLPDHVTLKTSNGEVFPAWCRWMKGTRTGLEFTERVPVLGRPSGTGT